jgi:HlyD family secretion protein
LKLASLPRAAWIALGAALVALAGFAIWQWVAPEKSAGTYRLAKVERGPLTAVVSATGSLTPVTSVQVGSQVSGQIKELFVDFNSAVKQGQLIAQIDPESFQLKVRQAEADLEAARATLLTQEASVGAQRAIVSREEVNLGDVKRDFERKETLYAQKFISGADRDRALAVYNQAQESVKTAKAQLAVAEAQTRNAEALVKQRQSQLAQARVDLDRTAIRSPVDGVVIKRSVDAGQTVAASLQAPELFVIAKNLTDMQVYAQIDEADVGRIRVGQNATFTVDSFPGRTFSGEVKEVRKSAQVVQNVVSYTVVVSAPNPDQLLLPGMTANARIVTDQRQSTLRVPNAALRFRPLGAADAKGASSTPQVGTTANAGPAATPAGAPGALGGAGQQLRERLVAELKLDAAQQARLEPLFAELRQKTGAARDLPEAERAKVFERARADLRVKVQEFLTPEQKARYAELVAESAGRSATRGRVYVLDANGEPKSVDVRLGLSDGTQTEVLGGDLAEGTEVIVGIANLAAAKSGSTAAPGPRLPF